MLLVCWEVPQDRGWGWGSCWRWGSSLPPPGNRPQLPSEATSFWRGLPPPPTVPVLPLGAACAVQPPRGQEPQGGAAEHRAQARPPPVLGGLPIQTHWGSPQAAGADLGGTAPGQPTARLQGRAPHWTPRLCVHALWLLQPQRPPAPEQGMRSWVFTAPRTPTAAPSPGADGAGGAARAGSLVESVPLPIRVVCHLSPLKLPLPLRPAPRRHRVCAGEGQATDASQWLPPSVSCPLMGTPDPRASHLMPQR